MVTKTPTEANANGLVECGLLMFHLGAPAFSLHSAVRSHPSIASLLPGAQPGPRLLCPHDNGPGRTGTTQPGESKG